MTRTPKPKKSATGDLQSALLKIIGDGPRVNRFSKEVTAAVVAAKAQQSAIPALGDQKQVQVSLREFANASEAMAKAWTRMPVLGRVRLMDIVQDRFNLLSVPDFTDNSFSTELKSISSFTRSAADGLGKAVRGRDYFDPSTKLATKVRDEMIRAVFHSFDTHIGPVYRLGQVGGRAKWDARFGKCADLACAAAGYGKVGARQYTNILKPLTQKSTTQKKRSQFPS